MFRARARLKSIANLFPESLSSMTNRQDQLILNGRLEEAKRRLERSSQLGGHYCGKLINIVGELRPGEIVYILDHLPEFGELLEDALEKYSKPSN